MATAAPRPRRQVPRGDVEGLVHLHLGARGRPHREASATPPSDGATAPSPGICTRTGMANPATTFAQRYESVPWSTW